MTYILHIIQVPDIIGSVLGPFDPLSECYDRLCEVAGLTCNFCLSMPAHTISLADPSLKYTSMLLGH